MSNETTAETEILEAVKWLTDESKRISTELDKEFGLERKIDGNRSAYEKLHQEFAHQMKVIGEKYNLYREPLNDRQNIQ